MRSQIDVIVWRGNSTPIEFLWPDGYAPSASVALTVWAGREQLLSALSGGGLVVDAPARRYLWDITVEQSRLIPLGKIAQYEIEDRSGIETTILFGWTIGQGGANDDGASPVSDGSLDFSNPQNSGLQLLGW